MIRKSIRDIQPDDLPRDFYRRKLVEALGAGVEALHDPEVEARVTAYFRDNPDYSRDAVHVAAIACRFKKEQVEAKAAQPVRTTGIRM